MFYLFFTVSVIIIMSFFTAIQYEKTLGNTRCSHVTCDRSREQRHGWLTRGTAWRFIDTTRAPILQL